MDKWTEKKAKAFLVKKGHLLNEEGEKYVAFKMDAASLKVWSALDYLRKVCGFAVTKAAK